VKWALGVMHQHSHWYHDKNPKMYLNDETLPTFIKGKHPRKGEKRKQGGQGPKPRQASKQTAQKRWATRRKGNH